MFVLTLRIWTLELERSGRSVVVTEPTTPPNKPKNPLARRTYSVDTDKIERKFLNVLGREANRLLDESYEQKLSEPSAKSLVNYLKLLKEFQKFELEALGELTDEELEQRSKTNKKGE